MLLLPLAIAALAVVLTVMVVDAPGARLIDVQVIVAVGALQVIPGPLADTKVSCEGMRSVICALTTLALPLFPTTIWKVTGCHTVTVGVLVVLLILRSIKEGVRETVAQLLLSKLLGSPTTALIHTWLVTGVLVLSTAEIV